MPSPTAKVTRHSANEACCELHHISAHFALMPTVGIVSIGLYISFCFFLSLIYVSMMEGIGFIVDVFHHELKTIEKLYFK